MTCSRARPRRSPSFADARTPARRPEATARAIAEAQGRRYRGKAVDYSKETVIEEVEAPKKRQKKKPAANNLLVNKKKAAAAPKKQSNRWREESSDGDDFDDDDSDSDDSGGFGQKRKASKKRKAASLSASPDVVVDKVLSVLKAHDIHGGLRQVALEAALTADGHAGGGLLLLGLLLLGDLGPLEVHV